MHAAFALHQSRTVHAPRFSYMLQIPRCSILYAHKHMCVYGCARICIYMLRKEERMKNSPGGEEHDIVRMPSIVSGTHSFKIQFILYSFIYFLCLCMLVCVGAYIYFYLIWYRSIWYDTEVSRRKRQQLHKLQEALRKHGKAQAASWKRKIAFFHCSAPDLS